MKAPTKHVSFVDAVDVIPQRVDWTESTPPPTHKSSPSLTDSEAAELSPVNASAELESNLDDLNPYNLPLPNIIFEAGLLSPPVLAAGYRQTLATSPRPTSMEPLKENPHLAELNSSSNSPGNADSFSTIEHVFVSVCSIFCNTPPFLQATLSIRR